MNEFKAENNGKYKIGITNTGNTNLGLNLENLKGKSNSFQS